jgi:hypothetical protein
MPSSSSSISLSLKEPLLVASEAVDDERCRERDQAFYYDIAARRLSLVEGENDGPQKYFQGIKNAIGCNSCIHWYISRFLLPLIMITQHITALVLLFPFFLFQVGFEDNANATTVHVFPPRLVIGSSLTNIVVLIWLYIHEQAPKTPEFLLRILHPAILGEMNIALMLILDNKEEVAIATLLISMVGVGAFVLFSVQDCTGSRNRRNNMAVEEKTAYLLTV